MTSRQRTFYKFVAPFLALTLFSLFMPKAATAGYLTDSYGGRDILVHVPAHLPPMGTRPLVLVLHGGLGEAIRIEGDGSENGMNMDDEADKNGFVVAYLNGTPVTRRFGAKFKGWNAGGGCCGVPYTQNIDDVGYITGAIGYLDKKYGVDPGKVFAIGHSNGAMMIQRLMCETTLLAATVPVSGPLMLKNVSCASAKGRRILAIHGDEDQNVPVGGGAGTKGLSRAVYNSEAYSQSVFTKAGATYTLKIVPGADHKLYNIDAALQKSDGQSLAQEATQFFGLTK